MKTRVNHYLLNGQNMISSQFKWCIKTLLVFAHIPQKYEIYSKVYAVLKKLASIYCVSFFMLRMSLATLTLV